MMTSESFKISCKYGPSIPPACISIISHEILYIRNTLSVFLNVFSWSSVFFPFHSDMCSKYELYTLIPAKNVSDKFSSKCGARYDFSNVLTGSAFEQKQAFIHTTSGSPQKTVGVKSAIEQKPLIQLSKFLLFGIKHTPT